MAAPIKRTTDTHGWLLAGLFQIRTSWTICYMKSQSVSWHTHTRSLNILFYLFITPRRQHRKIQTYKHTKHTKKKHVKPYAIKLQW